jgi:glycosyltransferase involved in cell wall biosynthesis
VGGTEVYVKGLARHLSSHGVTSLVVTPADREGRYEHDGIPVFRLPVREALPLRHHYDAGDDDMAARLVSIAVQEQADLVHFHAQTPALGLSAVRACRDAGLPVVLTYHTPTISCQRGTLMLWGTSPCDGILDAKRCTACVLQGLGIGRAGAELITRLPSSISRRASTQTSTTRVTTALALPMLVAQACHTRQDLFREVDALVVPCQWAWDLMLRNGVPAEKLRLLRQGIDVDGTAPMPAPHQSGALRLVFAGRINETKGVDTLVSALSRLKGRNLSLDIYGRVDASQRFARDLVQSAQGDTRIRFRGHVPLERVVGVLADYDAILVPSVGLETGPLVVLEARAARTPVIGSNLGGIAELVRDKIDGLLVKPGDAVAWASAIQEVLDDRSLLDRLRDAAPPPTLMSDTAAAMTTLYRDTLLSGPVQSRNLKQQRVTL